MPAIITSLIYHDFVAILEIEGLAILEIPKKTRWTKIDDVSRALGGQHS
jgi:hypothetical protein